MVQRVKPIFLARGWFSVNTERRYDEVDSEYEGSISSSQSLDETP